MKKIAILMQSAANGGVQKVMINLAKGFVRNNIEVEFIICDARGKMLDDIPKECNILDYKKRNFHGDMKILFSIFKISKYMKKNKDTILIAAPGLAGTIVAFLKIFRKDVKAVVVLDNKVSLLKDGSIYHTLLYYVNKCFLKNADKIVLAHKTATEDIKKCYKIENEKLCTIYHPLIEMNDIENTDEIKHKFLNGKSKILLAVGRLVPEKDYYNLIDAFAKVRENRDIKLIILGDGPLKEDIAKYIVKKDLKADIDLYGFTNNVYGFMKASNVFVLSSKQEAFGNVLIEAMACGIPVVTTECKSGGQREIMGNNNPNLYGTICPCEHPEILANSILKVLDNNYSKNVLKERVQVFTIDYSTKKYINVIKGIR